MICVQGCLLKHICVGGDKDEDKLILFLAFVRHLVLMFPGNSNFDKRDLLKPNETTAKESREEINSTLDQGGFPLGFLRAA